GEMLVKTSRLGCGIVASRTSPTELAVSLAIEANVALCGYVRRDQLRIFHDAGRLALLRPDPADRRRVGIPGRRTERAGVLGPAFELREQRDPARIELVAHRLV